jgi:NAD(P)-dependent dehydrogenase (short-subunit alcohol dehydrogenase family)
VSLYLYRRYVSGKKYQTVSLEGKVYIITGSNTGIGFETAKQLVEMGATVILACRTPDKAREARDLILSQTKCPVTRVIVIKLDLCGFDSVRKFVKEFRALGLPLNGLINNAGVMMQERSLTQDGFETVFTANHLSHFLLTNLLLPELEKSNGRIVNLTSALHKNAKRFIFEDVMSEKNYSLFGTYSQSKLANILFTFELQRR